MKLYSNYHNQAHRFANSEIVEMFFFQLIKNMGTGIIGVFIPVYFYTQGLSILSIMIIFTVLSALHGLFAFFLGGSIVFKIGIKHTFVLVVILQALSFLIIKQGTDLIHISLWVVLAGFVSALYSIAHHSYIALNIDDSSAGKEVAVLSTAAIFAGILTPFMGGLLISLFGFQHVFTVGSALLLASVIPLFFSAEVSIVNQVRLFGLDRFREFWKSCRPIALSTVGNGFNGSSAPLWDSLYMFKLLGGIQLLGALSSVVSAIQICVSYFGGSRSDAHKSVFTVGINGSIFARMFTFVSFHPYIAMMSEAIDGILFPLFATAYSAKFYKTIKGEHTISRVVAHESIWHTANVFALCVITLGVYFFGWYAFLLVGVFMITGKLIIRKQKVGLIS
jgi:MFS family permease